MKNFIEVFDNALSSEDCKYIIDIMDTSDLMVPGSVSTYDGDVKVVEKFKISTEMVINIEDKNPINDIISTSLLDHINKYKKLHPQLDEVSRWGVQEKYNLQKYKPNQGYFGLHCENAGLGSGISRVLAWMFYLNTVTDEGGTYFDNYDLTMDAVEGRCVIWPAYWTHMHRGIVSKTESKYIVTGWFNFIDNV